MKWNIEWVDLQNIERMTSECWRLSEKQLREYCERLSQQQDLIFAGGLGITFLEIMEELTNRQTGSIWSDIQKDVHMIQKMIQQGMAQDKHYWIRLYHDLSDQPEFYFYTKLGSKFIELIAAKLELDIPEEQKFLHHDLQKIQEICDTCDFQDVTMARETIASLKEQENMLFLSWLGADFLHIMERRYGEKEKPALPPEPEQKNMRRGLFHKKNQEDILEDSNKEESEDLDYLYDLESLSDFDEISDQDILSDQEALLNGKFPDMPLKNKGLTNLSVKSEKLPNMPVNNEEFLDIPISSNGEASNAPVKNEAPMDMPLKNRRAGKVKVKSAPSAAKIIWTVIICIVMCILGIYLFQQINKREIARKAAESLKNRNINQTEEQSPNVSSVEVQHQDMQAARSQPAALKKKSESTKQRQIDADTDVDASTNLSTNTDIDADLSTNAGESTDTNAASNMNAGSDLSSDSNSSTNTDTNIDSENNVDGNVDATVEASINKNTDSDSETSTDNSTGKNSNAANDKPDILPKYESFHSQYPDLFGWLTIPYTGIDHPVMQAPEKVNGELYFYLHHDYQGNAAEEGSLFVDSGSSCYPQDYNTVIYGHNMKNGRNFGMLESFEDQAFCESHRTIYYDTIYEKGTYQVAAVIKSRVLYQEEKGFRYYQLFNYNTHEQFQECVDFIKANQIYNLGVPFHYGDKLLMLSTCDYSRENGRLVVVAKKI